MTKQINNKQLSEILGDFLQIKRFKDYTINGLQVEGRCEVSRILTAVTASQAAIEAAVDYKADALLVHHGYFWRGEDEAIVGIKKQRLQTLLTHGINLYAYHLPLDQHPELGNNRLFAEIFSPVSYWQSQKEPLIWHAKISKQSLDLIVEKVEKAMNRQAQVVIAKTTQDIERLAWCTGAAQDFLTQAHNEGAQVYLSGEYAERTYHEAQELGCHFIACGHHASERAGIQRLGQWLSEQYNLQVKFFDDKNPF